MMLKYFKFIKKDKIDEKGITSIVVNPQFNPS